MSKKIVRVGIIGFGKVVQGFLELLPEKMEHLSVRHQMEIRVTAICDSTEFLLAPAGFEPGVLLSRKLVKNATGEFMGGTPDWDFHSMMEAFIQQAGVNLVVEALPPNRKSGDPGLSYLISFLSRKIPIVTVNKSPLVFGFPQLQAISQKNQTPFKFGGATAAALPTSDTLSVALSSADLYGFEGILNGTTNFMLTEMIHNHSSIEEELAIAIEMKICEPDPSFDIDGWDTAFKTLILTRAFIDPCVELGEVEVQGIRGLTYNDIAPVLAEGNTIKLLGKASYEEQRLRLRVKPSIITPDHHFFRVDGTSKAITFFTDCLGTLSLIGGASGIRETAAAILKDIINLSRDSSLI